MPGPVLTPPGFFGKLPTLGDFVTRRLPMSFVATWDPWITRNLVPRGDFPPLRFTHPGAMAGALTGVVLPSRDRAGRRFPLTLAAPGATAPPGWYAALAEAGEAAAQGALDAEALDARLEALPPATPGATDRLRLWLPDGASAEFGPEAPLARAETP